MKRLITSYNAVILIGVFFLGIMMYSGWAPNNMGAGGVFILVPIIFFICKFILELFVIDPDKNSDSKKDNKSHNSMSEINDSKSKYIQEDNKKNQ